MEAYEESEADIYQGIQANGNVQYYGNTFDMGSSTRPGGLADSILDPVFCCALEMDSFPSDQLLIFSLLGLHSGIQSSLHSWLL